MTLLHQRHVGEERAEQGHRRDDRGADRHALGDGLGRVAHRVEVRHDLAGLLIQPRHFPDAIRVVRDGAEGVHGHVVARQGEHPDTRHGHAVEHVRDILAPVDEDCREDRERR